MRMRFVTPPPEVSGASERLFARCREIQGLPAAFTEATADTVVPVYTLGGDDILRGSGTEACMHHGWQFLAIYAQTVCGLDVRIASEGALPAQITLGAFPGELQSALDKLAGQETESPEEFQPRLLRIPGLLTVALWLHHREPGLDRIIPLPPCPHPLQAGLAYGPEQFLREMASVAAEFDRFDNAPAGPIREWQDH